MKSLSPGSGVPGKETIARDSNFRCVPEAALDATAGSALAHAKLSTHKPRSDPTSPKAGRGA